MKAPSKKWRDHRGPVLDSSKGFEVIDCAPCGFKHIIPLPSPEEVAEIYRRDYYAQEKPLYIQRQEEDLAWWNLVFDQRYDLFERFLPGRKRRVLDVGAGPGFFLAQGLRRGWQTKGVEPAAQAAAHCRHLGLEIEEGFLSDEMIGRLGAFDVVHLSEVLEHVPDPRALLSLAREALEPGGLVCAVTPNDYNPFQDALRRIRGFEPWWVAPPHHINYFNFKSLQGLIIASKFEVIHVQATFPVDMFLLMGEDYVHDKALGRGCHARRQRLEQTLVAAGQGALLEQWYVGLSELGLGREAMVLARRPGE